MIEVLNRGDNIIIHNSEKKEIIFNINNLNVNLDGFDVSYPGEYEKSGILLEVKEYNGELFYNFLIGTKHLVIVANDSFEIKEEILSFFGDVDVLIIKGSKASAEIFENIEAKIVIPFGEAKSIFLNTLGQNTEEVDSYKIKGESSLDSTEFVNLK